MPKKAKDDFKTGFIFYVRVHIRRRRRRKEEAQNNK
jgi:hypothetical protein